MNAKLTCQGDISVMNSKSSIRVFIFLSLLSLLSVNICSAAVQLDEKFLQSTTGNSSVSVQVERFIEDIKNIRLNDGSHPKISGWQRKGNIYTFSFTTPTKIVLKFEHLVNQGGGWSSISAFEDGQPINAAALIMQITSMPRDKTKFDIEDEKNAAEKQRQQSLIEAANKKKQDERNAIIKAEKEDERKRAFLKVMGNIDSTPDPTQNSESSFRFDEYLVGQGTNSQSFYALMNKANNGDIQAMYDLGIIYEPSNEPRDQKLALKWFFRAAAKDHPAALYKAAKLYPIDDTDTKDAFMLSSANLGYSVAQTAIAVSYRDDKKINEYQEWLSKAAKQGEPHSIYLLACDLIDGTNGFKEDLREGIRLLKSVIDLEVEENKLTMQQYYKYMDTLYNPTIRPAKDKLRRALN